MTGCLLSFFICGDGGIGFTRTLTLDGSVEVWDEVLFDVLASIDEVDLSESEIFFRSFICQRINLLVVSSVIEGVSFGIGS